MHIIEVISKSIYLTTICDINTIYVTSTCYARGVNDYERDIHILFMHKYLFKFHMPIYVHNKNI